MRCVAVMLLPLLGACGDTTGPTAATLYGRYSIVNFADSHCRSVVNFRLTSRDTSVSGFATLVPNDSIVERLPMGRYLSSLFVQVYTSQYEFVYDYETADSVDVPGTQRLSHCLLSPTPLTAKIYGGTQP